MNEITAAGEPATELERLIADLSGSGLLVFVFGVGWWTAHLAGATSPLFRGPADRRWWHVELGDDAAGSRRSPLDGIELPGDWQLLTG